jgi:hypothetical protein
VFAVIAVVLYGDPSHVPGQPWDLGTSNKSGVRAILEPPITLAMTRI